jgi:hypothetical protein
MRADNLRVRCLHCVFLVKDIRARIQQVELPDIVVVSTSRKY